MRHDTALIIFLRQVIPGQVKTRLAADVGPIRAARIYAHLVSIALTAARQSGFPTYLYYADPLPTEADRQTSYPCRVQVDGHLGMKMHAALNDVLATHNRALLIGSDCPGINAEILLMAAAALDSSEVVIGPARDGGYYLIGTHQAPPPALFASIPWSTSAVLSHTLAQCQALGLSCTLLPELTDIDTQADWDAYRLGNTP